MKDNYQSQKSLEEVISSKISTLALVLYKYNNIPLLECFSILHLSVEYGLMENIDNYIWYEPIAVFYKHICKENSIVPADRVFDSVVCDKLEEATLLSEVFEGVRIDLGMYGATLERVFSNFNLYAYVLNNRLKPKKDLISVISEIIRKNALSQGSITLKPWAKQNN